MLFKWVLLFFGILSIALCVLGKAIAFMNPPRPGRRPPPMLGHVRRALTWTVFRQEGADDRRSEDRRLFHAILSLLYIARRRDPRNGGLGSVTLESILGCPSQHLEFPLWYLRERGWIERLDSGLLAITADGVDKIASDDLALPANRLLTERSQAGPRTRADGHASEPGPNNDGHGAAVDHGRPVTSRAPDE